MNQVLKIVPVRLAEEARIDLDRTNPRLCSPVRFPLYGISSNDDCVVDLILDHLSPEDQAQFSGGKLHVGSIICLEIPLIGWRNAQVQWIKEGQAGCRLLVPLTESELRCAIAQNDVITSSFPGLARQMNMVQIAARSATAAAEQRQVEIMRIPKSPHLPPEANGESRMALSVILSLMLTLVVWITLYVLSF